MNLDAKISKAKAKLLVDYPLFGTIASRLELIQNDDIQAFKSDGIKLEYNSDFFSQIESSKIEFALANGAMHASLAHDLRQNNRSGWLWQMATDFAINDMLVENGMDCPHESHYRVRFKGMYAEEIYAELKEMNLDNYNESSQSQEVNGLEETSLCNTSNQEFLTRELQAQLTQTEQLFEEFTKSIIEQEIKSGEAPKSLERFFKLELDGKIDWRDELRVALDRFDKDDYTLLPPNKKFLHLGFYLPSTISQRFKLVVAVDSSGSVDEKLLNTFLRELNFLMNTIPSYEIELLVCDDKIRSRKTFYSGDILEVDLIGGGATDFRPVFEFIEEEFQDTKLLLYFTDLDGIFPKETPNYDVKWIVSKDANADFGEVIILED